MSRPRQYPEELRERAVRMPGRSSVDRARIAELEREVRELRRANEILKTASIFF